MNETQRKPAEELSGLSDREAALWTVRQPASQAEGQTGRQAGWQRDRQLSLTQQTDRETGRDKIGNRFGKTTPRCQGPENEPAKRHFHLLSVINS